MAGGKAAVLAVKVIGDSDSAQAALYQVDKSVQKTEAVTKKSGSKMAGVWASVAAGMALCVKQSMALESATAGIATIFEEQAPAMITWAEGMASMGLSTAQAAASATVLGAQLKNAGATTEQMTVITQGLIETAAELAQVLGGSATEAVMAMGAAMRGEYDSLERYGITLTADAVATEAARLASEGFTAASQQQATMVAVLSLIQQQSTAILGENAEQTMTTSIATDHLKASTRNLAAEIGDVLTPANGLLIDSTANVIDGLVKQADESALLQAVSETLTQVLQDLKEILDPLLTTALETLQTWFDKLASFIENYVQPVLDVLADVLDTVAEALDKLIGYVQTAVEWFDNFTDSVHDAIDALTFWNDTYDPNADNPAAATAAAPARVGGAAGPQAIAQATRPSVVINVQGTTDPYALARLLTRQLEAYAGVQGRPVGQPLAEAW